MLSALDWREEALAASREAVTIRRRLAETHPDAFHADLAMSLINFANDLSSLGRREEALAASREALDIIRRLAAARPDAFRADLAGSLNNAGAMLSNLGRRDEARAASEGSVAIYRGLAETRPDAFLPDLARSLGALAHVLAQAERHTDAAGAFHEGLAVIAPFAEKHAQAFGDLAGNLDRDYVAACEKAGIAPDTTLLKRVAKALGGGADTDEAGVVALKAKIDAILDAAEKAGALDEDALAELPSGLAQQLRAAWAAARAGAGKGNPGS
jgi:tetratricopeptide (TPR) repeat protein